MTASTSADTLVAVQDSVATTSRVQVKSKLIRDCGYSVEDILEQQNKQNEEINLEEVHSDDDDDGNDSDYDQPEYAVSCYLECTAVFGLS